MAKTPKGKSSIVHRHPRRVPVSKKNPTGVTIVSQHVRHISGSKLGPKEIKKITKEYRRTNLAYPNPNDLKYKDGNKYDEIIGIWVDYFNLKFITPPLAPLDPNIIKALIASESDFRVNPKNPKAVGIAQITPDTLKTLQNPNGETKDFLFSSVRQKDLKDPEIAIPLAIRWIFRKHQTAANKLKRPPNAEELILEYKGLLKSKSDYQKSALAKFRKHYYDLKKK